MTQEMCHWDTNRWLLDIYLLTPWSTVLLEKLTGLQLVKKFPAFYGTRRFITAFTTASHLSLSQVSSIQSIPPHPTSWRSILILSSNPRLGLPSGLFPSGFHHQNPEYASPLTHTRYMHRPSITGHNKELYDFYWTMRSVKVLVYRQVYDPESCQVQQNRAEFNTFSPHRN